MDLSGGAEGAGPGAGLPDRDSPRQREAGAPAMNVLSGFPDYESADVSPGENMENPIQGDGDYPGTTQDGIPQYGGDEGGAVPGAPPAAAWTRPAGTTRARLSPGCPCAVPADDDAIRREAVGPSPARPRQV